MKRHLAICALLLVAVGCGKSNDGDGDGAANNGSNNGTNSDTNNGGDDAGMNGQPGDDAGRDDAGSDMAEGDTEPPYDDCAITVWPQDTPRATFEMLQEAMFDIGSGEVLCLADGIYALEEEVSLDTPDVEIRGASQDGTILDFSNQTEGANGLSATSDGVVFSTFTVRNTPGDGIRVTGANGVTFRRVTVTWSGGPDMTNGAYGIYPVQCQNVLVEESKVSHASDAGIYVGQSMNVIVRNNEAYGNVAGIEIENTTGADVHDNHAHNNTGGLLIFDLPGPPIQGGNSNKIHDNIIEDNNEPNFAAPGNIVGLVPQGTGVLILASDRNEIHNNTIRGNISIGVAVASFQTTGQEYDFNPEFDPFAEGNYVHDNIVENNGTDPKGFVALVALESELDTIENLLWDGFVDAEKDNSDGSLTNCFDANGDADYRMFNAPEGFANQTTELGDNACQGAELPRTVLE